MTYNTNQKENPYAPHGREAVGRTGPAAQTESVSHAEQELAEFRKQCELRAEEARQAAVRHGNESDHFQMQASAAEAAVNTIVQLLEEPSEVKSVPSGIGY